MKPAHPDTFEDLPLQVWTARPDGCLDYVNACTAAYFGISRERILDEGWKDLCHSLDLITAQKRWAHCLATGEDYEVLFRLMRGSDRSYRWHVARAIAMRDALGAITHWLGTNTDVDQREREHELALAEAGRVARAAASRD